MLPVCDPVAVNVWAKMVAPLRTIPLLLLPPALVLFVPVNVTVPPLALMLAVIVTPLLLVATAALPLAVTFTFSFPAPETVPPMLAETATPLTADKFKFESVPADFVRAPDTLMSLPLSTVKLPAVFPKAPMLMALRVTLPEPVASLRPITVVPAEIKASSAAETPKFLIALFSVSEDVPPTATVVDAVLF